MGRLSFRQRHSRLLSVPARDHTLLAASPFEPITLYLSIYARGGDKWGSQAMHARKLRPRRLTRLTGCSNASSRPVHGGRKEVFLVLDCLCGVLYGGSGLIGTMVSEFRAEGSNLHYLVLSVLCPIPVRKGRLV